MKKELVDFMAEACHYAQEHIGDPDAWPTDTAKREELLQCTSFQMACFLAQNTVTGGIGVEWEVVINKLASNKTAKNGMMVKSIAEWKKILNKIANDLGGWKKA
jgi:hypothetical protein